MTFTRHQNSNNYYVWNEVTGSSASNINGALTSRGNGTIYLYNKNGVVIGANGVVMTNGFVATTLDKVGSFDPTADMRFTGQASNDSLIDIKGTINALNGDVTIMGYRIVNSGTVTASDTVAMARVVIFCLSHQQINAFL